MERKGGLPGHLPERLTISFWLWNYFYGVKEGDAYHDLEKCFVEGLCYFENQK